MYLRLFTIFSRINLTTRGSARCSTNRFVNLCHITYQSVKSYIRRSDKSKKVDEFRTCNFQQYEVVITIFHYCVLWVGLLIAIGAFKILYNLILINYMFSKTTEYAIRATIYIAQKSSIDCKLGIEEISEAIDSPKSFTAKVLQILTKDECIISSTRGPNGGFYITEEAKRLPIRSVLIVTGEDETLEKCVLGLRECSVANPCPMHKRYKSIKQQLIQLFETTTIKKMAEDANNGNASVGNISE